jgi:hypothetical protein
MAVYQNVERLAAPAARAEVTEHQPLEIPYGRMLTTLAVLLSVALPLEGVIVALVLWRRERDPRRRRLLMRWAIGSAAWTCVSTAIGLVFIAAVAYSTPECYGGVNYAIPPSISKADGQNWTATYTCMGGGTWQETEPSMSMPYPRFPAGLAQPVTARRAGQI